MSFSTGVTNIDGVNVPTMYDRTSSQVTGDFQSQMAILQTYLTTFSTANPPVPPANPTLAQIQAAITALRDLATKGQNDNVDPNDPNSPTKQYYLTSEMAQSLDILFRSLNLVGVTFPAGGTGAIIFPPQAASPADPSNWNILWQDFAAASPLIQNAFNAAIQAVQDNGSLQSMIELGYVKTANDVLGSQLSSLEGALSTTNDILNSLGSIQDLHNQIKIYNSNFSYPYGGANATDASTYVRQYHSAASGFFGTPLGPVLSGDYYSLPPYLNDLAYLQNSLNLVFPDSGSSATLTNVSVGTPGQYVLFVPDGTGTVPNNLTPSPALLAHYNLILDTNSVDHVPGYVAYITTDGSSRVLDDDNFLAGLNVTNPAYYIVGLNQGNNSGQLFATQQGTDPNASFIQTQLGGGLSKPTLSAQIQELVKLRIQLSSQITALSTITPPSSRADSNSLYGRLQSVLHDITSVFVTTGGAQVTSTTSMGSAYAGFQAWMEDSYNLRNTNSSGNSGKIQQDITNAVTAGQSLNDTQKESVRRFLYVFEEYYKSASAILTKITQILERLAQGIAR